MEKIFKQNIFFMFSFGHLWLVELAYRNFFCQVHFKLSAVGKLFPLFATGIVYTGGKFAAGVVDTGGNLPPASLTPVANLPPVPTMLSKLVAQFAAGVVDTGGAPSLANIYANFQKNLKRS
jgi:hypothetical protein